MLRDGGRYSGPLSNGLPSGEGKLVTADGSVYNGSFRDGQPNGSGSLRLGNGTVAVGAFRDGHLVEGSTTYPDGKVVTGLLVNDEYDGPASVSYPGKAPETVLYSGGGSRRAQLQSSSFWRNRSQLLAGLNTYDSVQRSKL